MNLVFFDTETTGKDSDDRMIQMCYHLPGSLAVAFIVKPPILIKFEAMATHHITQEEVELKESFPETVYYKLLAELSKTHVFVAHNAKFDVQVMKNEGIEILKYIDTLKVAQHVLPDEPMYKLQYLRYKLGLKFEGRARAHDAEGDVLVLEALFKFLWDKISESTDITESKKSIYPNLFDEVILEVMIKLTNTPLLMNIIPFGKLKGTTFEQAAKFDKQYLQWLAGQKDLSEDLKFTLGHWLNPQPEASQQKLL